MSKPRTSRIEHVLYWSCWIIMLGLALYLAARLFA